MVGKKSEGSTFIQVPQDVENPQQLRRFLSQLIQQIDVAFSNTGYLDNGFVAKKDLPSLATDNPKQDFIDSLDQTISDPPTQEEVQAISDKVDEILVALRKSKIIYN